MLQRIRASQYDLGGRGHRKGVGHASGRVVDKFTDKQFCQDGAYEVTAGKTVGLCTGLLIVHGILVMISPHAGLLRTIDVIFI